MTHYFSKLARMTGLPVGGSATRVTDAVRLGGFPPDEPSAGAEPLHEEEALFTKPQPLESWPAAISLKTPPTAHQPVVQVPVPEDREAGPATAPAGPFHDLPPAASGPVWPMPDGSTPTQTIEFEAGTSLEPGRAGRAWQPPTAFEAQAQEPLRRFDAGGKLVLRAEHPSPDSRPVETAHRPAASLKPPATTAMPGLTDNLEQAFAPAGGLAGHEAKEPPSPTAAPLLPASEDKQNLPDSQAELWREINAWVSAQPAPAVAVDAQQAEPRRSEASRPLETAQDFSLSIGNISIIVEEPPRPPAAPLPPLAKGPSASAGGEGFFRLDRHYL